MRRQRSVFCLTAIGVALISATTTALRAQQREASPLIAALPFANGVVGDEHAALNALASGVPELILIELSRNPNLRTVEPARLHRVLSAQKLDRDGRIDDDAASRVGRILGAQWVVRGTFTSDGHGTIRIVSYVIDVARGQLAHSEDAEGKQENLASLIGQITDRLEHDMRLSELPREGKRSRELAQKASYEATLQFARAIEARDAGRVQEAIAMLQQLLADEPGYEPARNELTRLHSDRGR